MIVKILGKVLRAGLWLLAALCWGLWLLGCAHLRGLGEARGQSFRLTVDYKGEPVILKE